VRKNKKKKEIKNNCACCVENGRNLSPFFPRLLVRTREMPGARSCTTGHHRFMRLSAALVMSKHNPLTLAHAHTDTHSDTDTGQTHNTRDSDSLIFLSIFFLLFSQSAASHRFWLFGLVFRSKDEGGGPLNGQQKEQSLSF
jgi:hypothetical protein